MKNKRNGFTLAELLIVVAIIAVLVAVAIPVFTAQLNKAKYATDLANLRALYAIGTADYLANGKTTIDGLLYDSDHDGSDGWGGSQLNWGEGEQTKVEVVDENGDIIETFTFTGAATIEYYDSEDHAPVAYITSDYGESFTFGDPD